MKRILALILTVIMAFGCASLASAEETDASDKVEISFKVGDSTLMINGNAVEVETPYVVGAGTTLVPLRVITEAFGAKVTWVNETKEIILEYPDVNITLQIGNINATVNTHTETLPEAPVLSPNGVTMVPLRFISETFGATVGYDNETAAITVVKEAVGENNTISSSTDLPRIGDSYWNWSMLTPSSMMMTERYEDGTSTLFSDEDCEFWIDIYDFSEENDDADIFKENYDSSKIYYFSGMTLSKDEKGTDELGNRTFRITGRNKEEYVDNYAILVGKASYEVYFSCSASSEKIAEYTALLESFVAEFAKDDAQKQETHDLSNVDENGYRTVTDDDLKISFKVPAEYMSIDYELLNLMLYEGKTNEEISVGIYSLTETVRAKEEAEDDRTSEAKYSNPELCTVSEVMPYEAIEGAYYYSSVTNGLTFGDYEFYDVFFEKGDYLYNITITCPKDDGELFGIVMGSLTAEELDSAVTGTFLREKGDEEETSKISMGDLTIEVNGMWYEYFSAETAAVLYHLKTESALVMSVVNFDDTVHKTARAYANAVYASSIEESEGVKPVSTIRIGNRAYYTFTTKTASEEEGVAAYCTSYVTEIGRKLCCFDIVVYEDCANSQVMEEAMDIIKSLTTE